MITNTLYLSTYLSYTLLPPPPLSYNAPMRLTVEVLSVPQAANELKLHPNTVRQLIENGRLPAHRVGREWAILRPNLDWFKTLDRPPGRPPSPHEPPQE